MHPTAPLTFHSGGTEVRRRKGAAMRDVDHAEIAAAFLSSAAQRPAALLIEGELGIGRTTAWLAIAERARLAGFQVLSARAREEETGFGFGVASALVGDVEPDVLRSLPEVLRGAAERNLLHLDGGHTVDDRRAVVAAFTAIVNRLSETAPVLIAIDDLQWLDAASRDLLAFAARRLRGPVGLLLTERTTVDGAAVWLQLEQPNALSRLMLRPMDERRLQQLITERFGRSYSRPAMMRIAEVSGGNPFYAVEVARLMAPSGTTASLPPALAEIVEGRIGHLDDEVRRALLAAACVDEATIDVMAAVTSTSVDRLVRLLEQPESDGVIVIDGNRVQFTHPVLAHGVYGHAQPMSRRRMHRALAELESAPARRARHMALAVANADPGTLAALDAAASVSGRENPIVAAELLELAIGLGGDTVQRRLDAARHHLRAGDLDRCRALAESVVAVMPAGEERATAKLLVAGVMMARGEFRIAVDILQRAASDAAKHPETLLRAHLCLSLARSTLGDGDGAHRHSVQAMTCAEHLEKPHLISQALAVHVLMKCRRGLGLDQVTLDRAMALEDLDVDTDVPLSAHAVNAVVSVWMGRLDEADVALAATMGRRTSRGADTDLSWIQFHAAMVDIGLGRYDDAAAIAEDMRLRAEQVGGTHVRMMSAVPAALAAAYQGREQDSRTTIEDALADAAVPDGQWTTSWPTMVLGFLEVSLGNHAEALNVLQSSISHWQQFAADHITTFHFVPNAVEAMVAVNALDDAEGLVTSLEDSAVRLRHRWMSAVAARCRGMLLAARGDVEAAERAVVHAMAEHTLVVAPFERARTQLVLGQLQRRMRHGQTARATFEEALATFERLGTPIWSARAEAELARTNASRADDTGLTPSEWRVAELAATGMTNREVAAALFISPKTVESNLGRVYRKLGVRNRVELGHRMNADRRGRPADGEG